MTRASAMLPEVRTALARGRQLLEAGDEAGSLALFERVLASHPEYADVHYTVGLVHERGGRLEEARTAFERALAQGAEILETRTIASLRFQSPGVRQ